jgi:hypothetical protein
MGVDFENLYGRNTIGYTALGGFGHYNGRATAVLISPIFSSLTYYITAIIPLTYT